MHKRKINSKALVLCAAFTFLIETSSTIAPNQDLISASSEEVFCVQRIMEFWKDHDSALAMHQIEEFFSNYPESKFKDSLLLLQGDLYCGKGGYTEAIDCYNKIQEDPNLKAKAAERKEKMLLLRAQAEKQDSPNAAIKSYQELRDLKGTYASQANKELLSFLFEKGLHQQIVDDASTFFSWNINPKDSIIPMLIGRAYSYLNQHEEAMTCLSPLLDPFKVLKIDTLSSDQVPFVKSVLMPLIFSAHVLNELALVEEWAKDYERLFGRDAGFGEVLYVRAMTYKNCDHFARAEELIDLLLEEYPGFDKYENAALERALLQFKQRHWEKSHQAITRFLKDFPSSEFTHGLRQYLATASLNRLEEAEKQKELLQPFQEQLATDLANALEAENELSESLRPVYILKMCEVLYTLGRYDEGVKVLTEFVGNFNDDPRLYRVHLLLAACYEGLKDLDSFIKHAENALKLNNSIPERPQLQINLFVSYLKKAKEAPEGSEEQRAYQRVGAEHLYALFNIQHPLDKKQLNWLANYYYQLAAPEQRELFEIVLETEQEKISAERSLALYRSLLEGELPKESDQLLVLENDLLKMCTLYHGLTQPKEEMSLLLQLHERQEQHSSLPWKWRSRVLYLLGHCYHANGQMTQALEFYRQAAMLSKSDPLAICASKLAAAKLSRRLMSSKELNLENPEVVNLLKTLKDLQLSKVFAHEPLHLEAALEYVTLRASLASEEKQEEKLLFLLERVQKEFSTDDDIPSKEYHRQRKGDSHKGPLYTAYMQLIEGHIAIQESKISSAESDAKKQRARYLYETILQQKLPYSKNLYIAALDALREMESL